jgi:hypothetical protein
VCVEYALVEFHVINVEHEVCFVSPLGECVKQSDREV